MTKLIAILLSLLLAFPAHAQFSKSTMNSQVNQSFPDNVVGAITPQVMRTFQGNLIGSYQQFTGVNAQVGTTYTIALSDYGQLVTFNNANPIAVTLPQTVSGSNTFYPFSFYVSNLGNGTVTITPVAGTIGGASNLAVPFGQSVFIVSDGTNYKVWSGSSSGLPTISDGQILANTSGAPATPIGTNGSTWFDKAYCNTIGYLIVRVSNTWTCNNSIPANVDWFANVHGDGVTDDTAGINAVLAAVNGIVNFSSKVYCVKTAAGLTTTMANQILAGNGGALLSTCGADVNLLTINGDSIKVRDLSLLGAGLSVSAGHNVLTISSACTRCRVDNTVFAGGYYNIDNAAAYVGFYNIRTGNAHGPATIRNISVGGSSPGFFMDFGQIDQSWPVSVPSNLASISAWQSTHSYTTGNVVSNSGYYLQDITPTCTSAGSAPTNLDYGNIITDGTCHWQLVAPATFDAVLIDTGSVNVDIGRSDFTGPYTNGVHLKNSLAGTAPLSVILRDMNTWAGNITASVNVEAGSILNIHDGQIQNGILAAHVGIWLQSGFTGNHVVSNMTMLSLGNSSNGILDQAGASNGGTYANNRIYTGGGTGISIGANINNRAVIGNHAGSSSLGTNSGCILVSPGTGDYLNIFNNDCNGASSSGVTVTSVTGTHNWIGNPGSSNYLSPSITMLSNGNLGFGTETNPQSAFVFSSNVTTGITNSGFTPVGVNYFSANATGAAGFNAIVYGGIPNNAFVRIDNTAASPQTLGSGEVIGTIAFGGLGNNGTPAVQGGRARIVATTTEAWSGTTFGTSLEFDATAAGGSRAQAMLLKGGVIVGTGTTDPGANNLIAGGTIEATGVFRNNGNAGLSVTKTVRAAGGAADCTLIFTGGILTGGSC
jgi:hypothetical protein